MGKRTFWRDIAAMLVAVAVLFVSLPTDPAMAGWLATREASGDSGHKAASALERERVTAALRDWGLDPTEVERRVSGLTASEIQSALAAIENPRAGGTNGTEDDWKYGCLYVVVILGAAAISVISIIALF